MPANLEAQLRASLPGRETAVQDYAALQVAADNLRTAIDLLARARGTIATVLGNTRPATVHIYDADVTVRKAVLDLERVIKNHPAGRVPR